MGKSTPASVNKCNSEVIDLPLKALWLEMEHFWLVTYNDIPIVPPGSHISVFSISVLSILWYVNHLLFQQALLQLLALLEYWQHGVCTGKTSTARWKKEKVPVLDSACEETGGQTWTHFSKALCPMYFLFTFVSCWPSCNLALKHPYCTEE